MPKLPLSPFLLAVDADPARSEQDDAGRHDVVCPTAERGAMDLDSAELFVVATLRAWVAPHMRPGEQHPDWRELFRLAGVGMPGLLAFDGLMSIICAQAQRLIDVHCCRCPSLSDDERAMLRLVGALQAEELLGALDVLGDWLPGDAVGPALRAARRFAFAMSEAQLALPRIARPIATPVARTLH
jgi:hypothetical protein